MGYILVYGGRVYNEFILSTFGETSGQFSIITMILTSILLIVVLVLMWKVDWEKLFSKYVDEPDNLADRLDVWIRCHEL